MKMKNAIIAVAALAVGAAVGWFAGGLENGERGIGNGRARCPQRAVDGGLGQAALSVAGNGQDARCPSRVPAAKPRRKARDENAVCPAWDGRGQVLFRPMDRTMWS